jgi:hypothetical protein
VWQAAGEVDDLAMQGLAHPYLSDGRWRGLMSKRLLEPIETMRGPSESREKGWNLTCGKPPGTDGVPWRRNIKRATACCPLRVSALQVRIPTKAATYSNLIPATIPT